MRRSSRSSAKAEGDLEAFGEQGVFTQIFGVYRGRQAWLAVVGTAVTLALFEGGVYAAWRFFNTAASEP